MEYGCVTDLAKLQDYLDGARLIAFDFETAPRKEYRRDEKAALDAHKADIAGVSFSVSDGTAVYVPLRHRTGRNAGSPDKIMQWLSKSVFENKEIVKIAHNLSFEAMFLYALGVVLQPPCYDTIAAAQMTLKSSTSFRSLADSGLKTLTQELYGVELPSFETVTAGRYFDELDPQDEETIRYACADSDYTLRLYYLFNNWFDRYLPKHRFIVEKLESPAAVYCGLMKYNGLLADKELMLKKQAEAEERIKQLKEEIAFMIGDVNIGANASTSAFKKYLYGDLKLPVFKTTAKYQEAMDLSLIHIFFTPCRKRIEPASVIVHQHPRQIRFVPQSLQHFFIDGAFCRQVQIGAVFFLPDAVDAGLGLLEIAHAVVEGIEHHGAGGCQRHAKPCRCDLSDKYLHLRVVLKCRNLFFAVFYACLLYTSRCV